MNDEETLAKAFIGLVPHAGQEHLQEILDDIHVIETKELRAQAIKAVAPLWLKAPKSFGTLLWKDTLFNAAKRPRPSFLSDLQSLAPVLYHVGGTEAVKEVLQATQDITRWWG
jgi:hypothetical protein